uniref:Death domain-containing protein n=1 Tax=Amphimedon queenslandica TaxID=400682 RepID=A0A1X7SN42_AMPQE
MMSTVRAGSWRDLSTNEMSYGSQRKISAFLDSSHTLNWKDLLSMMPEYNPLQMQQLSQQEARGKSPTISLLSHMASRGRTVGQLYDFCKTLGMNRICELIVQGLQGSITEHQSRRTFAYSSFHSSVKRTDQSDLKPNAKPSLSPPSSSSLHPPLSHETTPTQILSYEDVKKATGDFDNVLFSEGGHKLGQGGFGVVYQGQINLGEGNREVAVKVFVDDANSEMVLQFKTELHTIS